MIIFFNAGQLGNQIFQYSFLETVMEKNEKIMTSYCTYFDIFNYQKEKYIFVNKYLRFFIRRFSRLLITTRLITYIKQDQAFIDGFEIDLDTFKIRKGLFSYFKYVDGYFQSEKFIKVSPKIKDQYYKISEDFLTSVPSSNEKVFVHVRRGDYLEWSVLGKKNPSLPFEFFEENLKWFNNNLNNPFFIFLTDDKPFVEKTFQNFEPKIISVNPPGVDLAIMSLCSNGITSNSTLSWWGAYLLKENKKVVFSPKYWLGWRSRTWFPVGIQLEYINYKEVKLCAES